MNTLADIPRIKKLADQFGTPMIDVTFIGEGVVFTYKVGDEKLDKPYSSVEHGIQEELSRLKKFLSIEI